MIIIFAQQTHAVKLLIPVLTQSVLLPAMISLHAQLTVANQEFASTICKTALVLKTAEYVLSAEIQSATTMKIVQHVKMTVASALQSAAMINALLEKIVYLVKQIVEYALFNAETQYATTAKIAQHVN